MIINSTNFRASYIGNDGRKAKDIRDWASDNGNLDLTLMAKAFLTEKGELHWPPSEREDLEYPRDIDR